MCVCIYTVNAHEIFELAIALVPFSFWLSVCKLDRTIYIDPRCRRLLARKLLVIFTAAKGDTVLCMVLVHRFFAIAHRVHKSFINSLSFYKL